MTTFDNLNDFLRSKGQEPITNAGLDKLEQRTKITKEMFLELEADLREQMAIYDMLPVLEELFQSRSDFIAALRGAHAHLASDTPQGILENIRELLRKVGDEL